MATFIIPPLQTLSGVNAKIKKPTEIAHFSFDSNHMLRPFSNESLRYYYPPFFHVPHTRPAEPIDLEKGFNTFRAFGDSHNEHLDGLLDTLVEAERRSGIKTEADLITWRGTMTKFLTMIYYNDDDFEMNATLFQNTIFIEENFPHKLAKRDQERQRRAKRGNRTAENNFQDVASFRGYKFETLAMLKKPWAECTREEIEGRNDDQVETFSQYCSLVKTGIGSTSMILAGEVDGVLGYKPDDPNEPARWVELKTSAVPDSQKGRQNHDKKMLKFWAQSFLLGVPRIYIGYRSRSGYLEHIEELETRKIPDTIKRTGVYKWDGNICVNATAALLSFLQTTIQGEGVWRIRSHLGKEMAIEVFRIEETGTGDILKPSFVQWREELALRTKKSELLAAIAVE